MPVSFASMYNDDIKQKIADYKSWNSAKYYVVLSLYHQEEMAACLILIG